MAETWHKTPAEIIEGVSAIDMQRWRVLRAARYEAENRARAGVNQEAPKPELDPADLIDGAYLPDADDDA